MVFSLNESSPQLNGSGLSYRCFGSDVEENWQAICLDVSISVLVEAALESPMVIVRSNPI